MDIASSTRHIPIDTIMAFDFGTQKMGIAIGQTLIESATPLALFPMKDGKVDWVKLLAIIQQWQPQLCLVGLPLNMDDSESELSLRARKFARRLRHHSSIRTLMVDERLTTREARQYLYSSSHSHGTKKEKLPHSADSIAAALMIESWYRDPTGYEP